MAGIEKICEYSGDYEGHVMYKHKIDSIQVLPKHRHQLKDKLAVLIFFRTPRMVNFASSEPQPYCHWYVSLGQRFNYKSFSLFLPKFWTRYYWAFRKFGPIHDSPAYMWDYCLYIPDCQGEVKGRYYNWTTNPVRAVQRVSKLADVLAFWSIDGTEQEIREDPEREAYWFRKADKLIQDEKIERNEVMMKVIHGGKG
jgi:hypothetical protein